MFSIIVDWSALAELSTYASFSIASAFDFEFVTFNTAISFPKTSGLEIWFVDNENKWINSHEKWWEIEIFPVWKVGFSLVGN